MKVAINATHGTFGLSPDAIKLYCKKIGKPCYFFNLDYSKDGKHSIIWSPTETPTGALRWQAFSDPNPTEKSNPRDFVIRDDFKQDRANKSLIETIEELGEKANGPFAKLKVVEVPDDVNWHIAEFDGWEWVAENHRTWE